MKLKYALIIIVVAILFNFFGMTFKFYHWPGADEMITASFVLRIVAVVCLVWASLSDPWVRTVFKKK